ncbi:undecaprenyl-diphosphate phosphatase [Neptunicoccus cionae]|uniref:undecaprenyl-diphosphate phosphatase n=1 Tax=Neptunicoccus cionae TaxID=2035344 RepID=UPI000C77D101|nr:undecaprenyl-diphosphate phosphatase [Amylibacter cionae]PLS22725.1 undecaprenyl-diphosphate phosphatase [Amylibacter cionae]
MPLLHLLILAIVQGITEFLPVSSSGHLILLPNVMGVADQGQLIDVAVHIGTLGAVILFFWKDSKSAFTGLFHLATGNTGTQSARLALLLIIATIPAVLFGLVLKLSGLSDAMRNITVIGWTMLAFGILLYIADQRGAQSRTQSDWGMPDAIKLGLWQAVALIPGTSRSGIAITGARFLGYKREDGTRIAMLMSIPVILSSAVLLGVEAVAEANAAGLRDGAIAAVFSFLTALLALSLMMRLLRSVSFTPYVIYRVILGLILLGVAYS